MDGDACVNNSLSTMNCHTVTANHFDLSIITVAPTTSAYLSACFHGDDYSFTIGPCLGWDLSPGWQWNWGQAPTPWWSHAARSVIISLPLCNLHAQTSEYTGFCNITIKHIYRTWPKYVNIDIFRCTTLIRSDLHYKKHHCFSFFLYSDMCSWMSFDSSKWMDAPPGSSDV